jgi:ABC-type transport system substrate-binding protein
MLVTTAIFVAVCFHFTLSGVIPDVDCITTADAYVLIVYGFLFLEMLAATWSHVLVRRGRDEGAARLERAVRWVAPPLLVLGAAGATWLGGGGREEGAAAGPRAERPASSRPELVIGVDQDVQEYGHYMNVHTTQMLWRHLAFWAYEVATYDSGANNWLEEYIPSEANGWGGVNCSRWRDPRLKPLYERIERAFNPDDLAELLARQQDIWAEELPAPPLYSDRDALFIGPGLRGVRPHVLGASYTAWNAPEWRFTE